MSIRTRWLNFLVGKPEMAPAQALIARDCFYNGYLAAIEAVREEAGKAQAGQSFPAWLTARIEEYNEHCELFNEHKQAILREPP